MTPTRPSTSPPATGHRTRTPLSTYRLQLGPGFPFSAAEKALPHFASLGISHLHLSPVLTAVPGSSHGYDVTDHSTVRDELGGEEGLRSLAAAAGSRGIGLVVDIVPNHMAVPADLRLNPQLWQMLREGPGSPCSRWFDVDWDAGDGRMLLPVLAGPLQGELPHLSTREGTLRYGDRVLPLRPGTAHLPLAALLDAQHYRLAWWRLARTDLNYRRFFTVSELIGVRVEDPVVFDAVHGKVLQLLHEGVLDGLRVDHPDGLADPGGYVHRLHAATAGRWTVVEKILARDEQLPAGWPTAGTTGYDALHRIDGLFIDPAGLRELAALYDRFTGAAAHLGGDWASTARHAASRTLEAKGGQLAAESGRLTRSAGAACAAVPALRQLDHSPTALRTALEELLVRLPVYRPYVTPGTPAHERDVRLLEGAAEEVRNSGPAPDRSAALDTVRDLALGRFGDGPEQRDFAGRFGQVASALHAKAVEDTAFYRYAPLLAACEVGGSPGDPAVPPAAFHSYCAGVQFDRPTAGTVLSTHDTKRSADVRAALAVLTECPERWAELLAELEGRDPSGGADADATGAPDRHTAWVAWQTVFGLGTPDPDRLSAALLKSVREAGLRTTWTEPDPDFEAGVRRFASSACDPQPRAMDALTRELAAHVRANVLGSALLHLTMPGVPDVYQGTERLYSALVDPDNRRPVEFGAAPQPGLDSEKLRLTRAALWLRQALPGQFGDGASYEPLYAEGVAAEHCLAFVRSGCGAGAGARSGTDVPGGSVTAVTRLSGRLHAAGGWQETELWLPPGSWRDALADRTFDGGAQPLAVLFADSPVALLVRC